MNPMLVRTALPIVAAALVTLVPGAAAHSADAARVEVSARVYVEVQADGRQCVVGKVHISCAHTLDHLRGTLGLEAGAPVGVRAHNAAPYLQVKAVLDLLRTSEFSPPVLTIKERTSTETQTAGTRTDDPRR